MMFADNSRLGRPFAKDPSAIRFRGRYLLYFSLSPFAEKSSDRANVRGWSIGIAKSENLLDWEKIGELLPAQDCDRNGLCAPGALVINNKVHLFYQTYGNGPKDAICHAVSEDGIDFKRDPSNPIFRPHGPWTSGRAIDAEAFPFGDRLLLYFATRDPAMKTQMVGVAEAPLGSDYGRDTWRQLVDGPVLKPELPWEKECIEAPSIVTHDGTLFMFYAGAYNNQPQQIGCASSPDGVSWKRLSNEPLLPNGKPGEWNSSESGHPGAFVDEDGQGYLFYQGNNDHGKTWFLSVSQIHWSANGPGLTSLYAPAPKLSAASVTPMGAPRDAPAITYPVAALKWDGGLRAKVDPSSEEKTPDGEQALRVTLTGSPAPELRSSDKCSLIATGLPEADSATLRRPVQAIDFWFRSLDASNEPVVFVLRGGYGEQIPLMPNHWRRIRTKAFGPSPLPIAEIKQLVWRTAMPPAGSRFLLGPVRVHVDPHPPLWRPVDHPPFAINGLPWLNENRGAFIRLPARAESIDGNVWAKAQWPAGGRVRFKTDSSQIRLRIHHGNSNFPWPMMSAMSMAGLELYEGPPTRMTFKAVTTPASKNATYEVTLAENLSNDTREYTIYLPMYAALTSLEIGLDPNATVHPPSPFQHDKPVVFYGTSFVHGAGASRPSMNFPAIIARALGIDFVNLGFSSEGRWETAMASLMAEIDAACFVVGPILNNPELMADRYPAFVKRLREGRPTAPIILMTRLHTAGIQEPYAVNGLVKELHETMRKAGDEHVYLFDSFPLYSDGALHPTIEGTHPTDLGFKIISDALAPHVARTLDLHVR